MPELKNLKCIPCEGGMDPLTRSEFERYLKEVSHWQVTDDKKISKNFKFKDFSQAIDFINRLAEIAEKEGHHPDIYLYDYNKVKITLTTHAIGGLSPNDFVIAYQTDQLLTNLKS